MGKDLLSYFISIFRHNMSLQFYSNKVFFQIVPENHFFLLQYQWNQQLTKYIHEQLIGISSLYVTASKNHQILLTFLIIIQKICQDMQGTSENLRYQLWDKLKVIFDKYAEGGESIHTSKVETIVREVLGETTSQEIDYVIKNMFRLDADGSGTVDFLQFGNFLFKRHCGQMSLQTMHRANLIQKGSERKIKLSEFFDLVNKAYSFLKVKVNQELAEQVFAEADKDKDGYITYVEYFQFIQKCVCQTKAQFAEYQKSPEKVKQPEPLPPVVDLGRQWNSRLRLYLWLQLRKLYDAYVLGKKLTVNDQNLRGLIKYILGDISQMEITFILNGLFKLDKDSIEFIPFAITFLYLVAELGLSRFQRNHPSTKKTLTADEFLVILHNTFKFLNIGRVRKAILLLLFGLIDKNKDGLISLNEYLDWVKRFIAVDVNRGDQFYLKEDDQSLEGGDIFEAETPLVILPDPQQKKLTSQRLIRFNFSSYDLSDLVRKRVWQLLVPFDKNKDLKFDEHEIHTALIELLKENQYQLKYVTRNVFRYDVDGDKNVTYDELTNFCVEQHFGEMAIQRLHRKNSYSRGKERMMNEAQFGFTLNNALGFIGLSASPEQIARIFKEIDLGGEGWISYEIYFLFLKYYFGSLRGEGRVIQPTETKVDPDKQWYDQLLKLSALDRFIRLIFDQLRNIFSRYDFNKNMLFEEDEIEAILHHVFGLNETEISYVLHKFFNFASRKNKSLTFDELVRILLQIYFVEIILKRRYKDLQSNQWKTRKINLNEFIELVLFACFFLRVKPSREDLTEIFNMLDTDKDGYITFSEYIDFIRKYLGLGIQPEQQVKPIEQGEDKKPENVSTEQWTFILLIWSELKAYFDKYDSGSKGYMTEEDLRRFVIEVLHENTERQLNYVFWNLFRVDPNTDRKTQFHEFAPFILNHTGEIALQKFHREQIKGKSTLTEGELFIVFSNAFSFLSTMPKSQAAVNAIYKRIGNGSDPSYAVYLGWINKALASKFKKP